MFASLAFLAAGAGAIGFMYWSMISVIDTQIDGGLARDSADLTAIYEKDGYLGLRSLVAARASPQPHATRLYMLKGPDGTYTGNVEIWPDNAPPPGAAACLEIADPTRLARVRTLDFKDGTKLLIGRTWVERENLKEVSSRSIVLVIISYLLLGAAAGTLISYYASRRLSAINATAEKVLDGDLSVRAEVRKGGDEYDHLAQNFNAMLDRIQRLMATVRGVTENIAHDLRTPLNRMRGRLELALIASRKPEEYEAVLNRAIAETETIVDTFNSMLKVARMTSGALALPQKRIDLGEVATELLDLYHVFAEENNVTLEVRLPAYPEEPSVYVLGDGHLISQAASNLLDNAIKYSPSAGRVVISVSKGPQGASLTVADHGPGIPPDKRAVILERFVRLEGTSEKPGFGLGLSFALAVAEWHRAQLTLSDNKPGLRATLTFRVRSAVMR